MSIIRRKFYPENEIIINELVFGEPIFERCICCNGWIKTDTKEHVELVTRSLNELIEEMLLEGCENTNKK